MEYIRNILDQSSAGVHAPSIPTMKIPSIITDTLQALNLNLISPNFNFSFNFSLDTTTTLIKTIFWKYLHLTPFIIILWPLIITLLFSLTSASTWLFWLFTSLIFGSIQLIYVLYQFVMISIDLGVLSVLKTYTSMRSIVRYYTIRSGNSIQNSINKNRNRNRNKNNNSRKARMDDDDEYFMNENVNKRGRKREWRKKLDAAKSLNDFLQIEIQEPPPSSFVLNPSTTSTAQDGQGNENGNGNGNGNNNNVLLTSSTSSPSLNAPLSLTATTRSKSNTDDTTPFLHSSTTTVLRSNKFDSIRSSSTSSTSSFHRSQSNIEFHNHHNQHRNNHNDHNHNHSQKYINRDEIEKELGMTGTMLLQTTFRLKETRMQASSTFYFNKNKNIPSGAKYLSFLNKGYGNDNDNHNSNSNSNNNSGSNSGGGSIHESKQKKDEALEVGEKEQDVNCEDDDDDDDDDEEDSEDNSTHNKASNSNSNHTSPSQQQQQQHENNAASQLKFLLQGVVKRNHLSINDLLIQDALSVMECGRHYLSEQSRNVILSYHEEVEHCLKWISQFGLEKQQYYAHGHGLGLGLSLGLGSGGSSSNGGGDGIGSGGNGGVNGIGVGIGTDTEDSAILGGTSHGNNGNNNNNSNNAEIKLYKELSDRLNLIRKLKHNMGRTALMLSGGGAQAMYHLGTIKALCESKLYDDIEVISGTSGGSIAAAMCAIKTRSELLEDVCVPHVSTDYGLTGEMKEKDIRWFPRVVQMGEYWLKHKLLVDSKDFKRCCDFYFGDITFEEAFERTGKHVCITVSASRAEESGGGGGGDGAQRLLLNHISTPHVTLASAVAASCALPGVMAPAKLVTKNKDSKQELFEVDGVEWIDGSVQADLPFKRISTLFNVSNYIVCQTNFHVLPFLHKAHHPNTKSFYWRAFQTCEWDIRNRALNLSRLGLFPKIFGQDISKVFKQKYHGDLTLVPRFTTMQVFGLKALVNPTYEDMEVYLQNGQSSAWPYLSVIREMLRLETAIDKCIKSLNERIDHLSPESDWDDVESFTSATTSRYRPLGARRENELLKQKVHSLELENLEMKKQLELMQRKFGIKVAESEQESLHPIPTPTGQIEFVRSEQSMSTEKKSRRRLWKKE